MARNLAAVTIASLGLAGCWWQTTPEPEPTPDPTPGPTEEAKPKPKPKEENESEEPKPGPTEPAPPTMEDPLPAPKPQREAIPTASPVPGRPGFVFSPFNNKLINVEGIASGTLVADPQFPAAEKKFFRVP